MSSVSREKIPPAVELGFLECRPLLSPRENCNLKHRLSQRKIIKALQREAP